MEVAHLPVNSAIYMNSKDLPSIDMDSTEPIKLEAKIPQPLPADLSWLPDYIGRDEMNLEDLDDGFVLIQVLSIIAPNAVDLAWYTTDAALKHPNLTQHNRSLLLEGISKSTDIVLSVEERDGILAGDMKHISSVALKMKNWSRLDIDSSIAKSVEVPETKKVEQTIVTASTTTPWCWDYEYEPSEVAFKSSVRWLLMFVKRGCHTLKTSEKGVKQLEDMIDIIQASDPLIPAGPVISSLAHGAIYHAACILVFDTEIDTTIEEFLPTREDKVSKYPALFLETLQKRGFLDFRAGLKDAVKDMVSDRTPFYESIHSKIIENLINASLRSFTTEMVAAHLKERFPKHNPAFAPYDLEDALLMWTNTCALQLADEYAIQQKQTVDAEKHPSTPPIMPLFIESWTELDNFCKDFRDGRAFNIIASYYGIGGGIIDPYKVYPRRRGDGSGRQSSVGGSIAVNLTLAYRTSNLELFERACSKSGIVVPPWRPEELARAEGNISRIGSAAGDGGRNVTSNSVSTTAFRYLLQVFLYELFQACVKIPVKQQTRRPFKVSRKHLKEVALSSSGSSRPDTGLLAVAAEDASKVAIIVSKTEAVIIQNEHADMELTSSDQSKHLEATNDSPLLADKNAQEIRPHDIISEEQKSESVQLPNEIQTDEVELEIEESESHLIPIEYSIHSLDKVMHDQVEDVASGDMETSKELLVPHSDFVKLESNSPSENHTHIDNSSILDEIATVNCSGEQEIASTQLPLEESFPSPEVDLISSESVDAFLVNPMKNPLVPPESKKQKNPGKLDEDKIDLHKSKTTELSSSNLSTKLKKSTKPPKLSSEKLPKAFKPPLKSNFKVEPPEEESHHEKKTAHATILSQESKKSTPASSSINEDLAPKFSIEPDSDAESIERKETTSFAHQLHREFLLEKQHHTALLVENHATMPSQRVEIETTYPLQKVSESHYNFSTAEEENEEGSADSKPVSAPEFDVDGILGDNNDEEEEDINSDIHVTFQDNVIEQESSKSWHRPATRGVMEEIDQDSEEGQREQEQMDLIASRSRIRAAQKAAEKEMALAAARASSTISHVSSNSLKLPPVAGPNQIVAATSSSAQLKHKKTPMAVVPKMQSNRKLIKNALQVCLAGTVNEKVKNEVLEDLETSSANHFIILFRGLKNHAFKGLYSYDPQLHQVLRVYAPAAISSPQRPATSFLPDIVPPTPGTPNISVVGPNTIAESDVLEYYKYDSGSRSFKALPTKSFGVSVHAVAVRSDYGRRILESNK
ncbi:hypothetical protein BCR33DRAFT_717059 [Rhizoclosmatium globosum]|uniref:CKK domain-containing protein n=1 Tax=Rhizoclosmatium globosum TaxID=329046 RepID=A0A1Y2CC88_9FUNG|nr:hypothetical protein BCR33DRAFT_717059 [Rhizoclosmatium globosum]|eukprot:ORY44546.1 hypothetical protein BCR33DRAFT_717059 [Rhizoclosmatium globosum]